MKKVWEWGTKGAMGVVVERSFMYDTTAWGVYGNPGHMQRTVLY